MLRKVTGLLVVGLLILVPQAWGADLQQSIDAYLTQLPSDFETVGCKTLSTKQGVGENVFVLDVREPAEYQAGHIEGAVNIPVRTLAKNLDKLPADKATQIAVVCKSGIRAAYATMTLKLLGYGNVKDVAGGMMAWEKEGLPVTK
ncbi:MAG: rhodanese-like domain-containing protein [Candidatus Methylomirabilota bacterium]